jgi:enoyl-CoA hydratase
MPGEGREAIVTDEVLVEVGNGTMVISINRPAARNAIDMAVAHSIAAAVDDLDSRPDVSVGILTGVGGFFSAGMDLKGFARGELPTIPGRGLAGITERPPAKPLIAAVEGPALAGGCELALACDVIIAARTASFGLPEVSRGLVASGGGLLRLVKAVPYGMAMELALTGRRLGAEEAHAAGLVTRLTDEGEALGQARRLAADIAANAPMAIHVTKAIIARAARWTEADMIAWQRAIAQPVLDSADALEGARAFSERRPPRWTGH